MVALLFLCLKSASDVGVSSSYTVHGDISSVQGVRRFAARNGAGQAIGSRRRHDSRREYPERVIAGTPLGGRKHFPV